MTHRQSAADSDASSEAAGAARLSITFAESDLDALGADERTVAAFFAAGEEGPALDPAAAALDAATGGQVARALSTAGRNRGDATTIVAPHGLAASALVLVCVGEGGEKLDVAALRRLGAATAAALAAAPYVRDSPRRAVVRVDGLGPRSEFGDQTAAAAELALGMGLRAYRDDRYRSSDGKGALVEATVAPGGDALEAAFAPAAGLIAGVTLTRDLVNAPANHLTTDAFADEIRKLDADGLTIDILDEARLESLGMRALLAVGRGSRKPSYVGIMRWNGADDPQAAPACLVGKGVVFDTGGISLKPPANMEEMTMDMGGAAVVVGAMKAIARRKSRVNAVGLVGLVENMPDGDAQRPGDIVTSMAGKTIEVINTDAEGRLVLADVLHHAQEAFRPRFIVDLATLTGAMIVALGHEKAGFFANDEALAGALEAAAASEGEGLWRMPLDEGYDKQLKSRLADMKNVGGRDAGSITAAQFLQRFIQPDQAWAHIDIAGVTLGKQAGPTWPKGPTGWGVATLVRLVEDAFAAS